MKLTYLLLRSVGLIGAADEHLEQTNISGHRKPVSLPTALPHEVLSEKNLRAFAQQAFGMHAKNAANKLGLKKRAYIWHTEKCKAELELKGLSRLAPIDYFINIGYFVLKKNSIDELRFL